jgi:hypothetical protein
MKTMLKASLLTFLLLAAGSDCFADLMRLEIHSPKECPEGLTIKSKLNDGMIVFDVDVDPEKVAHAGQLYKGRVRADAFLNIGTPEQQVAFVQLHEVAEGTRTLYHFRVSRSAARTCELQLAVSLYEKDGMPTIGGGVSIQIRLAGFDPKVEEKTNQR